MIGIIDSGVGGLSVVKEMQRQGFNKDFVYLGDGANVPYGVKTPKEITKLSLKLVDYLVNECGITSLIIACNTIISAAYDEIKKQYPSLPIENIVGHGAMAALLSFNDEVCILSTSATANSQVYSKTIYGLDENIKVHEKAASDLVMLVENNDKNQTIITENLKDITPNTDILILGCTHFPFLYDEIRQEVDASIQIIDPAYSCVQHLMNANDERVMRAKYSQTYLTTGKLQQFISFMDTHAIAYDDGAVQKIEI